MTVVVLVLFVAALVAFLLATFGASRPHVHCGWLGAALLTIALVVSAWPGH